MKLKPLLLAALALASGCGHSGGTRIDRRVALQLGSAKAACQGQDRIIKAIDSTTITRRLTAAGGCAYDVYWAGRLIDGARLREELQRRGTTQLQRVGLVFEPAQLVDELGETIGSLPIKGFSLELKVDNKPLLRSEHAAERVGPLGEERRVALAKELVDALQLAMTERKPMMATVTLKLELSETARRELAAKARGPLLELKFAIDLASAPPASGKP